MPDSEELPSYKEFENLFVNNTDLERISAYLNRFNPIKVMRAESMEIRHSNILAWLMNPNENHGLGDGFLKAFLAAALRGQSAMGEPTSLDILSRDLRDVEIKREWKHIDIFIYSEKNNWAFIIENKYKSKQRKGQLADYWKVVEDHFKQMKKTNVLIRGIFLMINEEAEDIRYVPISYENVANILSQLIDRKKQELGQEAFIFLQHYLDILMEEAGMSEEKKKLQELARELYRSHQKVLDFITEYAAKHEFNTALETLFGSDTKRHSDVSVDGYEYTFFESYYFLPASWTKALGGRTTKWAGCEKWLAKYPLILFFVLSPDDDQVGGTLRLYGEVGPLQDYDVRKCLIDKIKKATPDNEHNFVEFKGGAYLEKSKNSKFFKVADSRKNIKDIKDAEEIAQAMKDLLKKFRPTFEAIAKILPKFADHAEKEET